MMGFDFRPRVAMDAQTIDCTDTVDIVLHPSRNNQHTIVGVVGVLRQSAAIHLKSFSNAQINDADLVWTIPKNSLPADFRPAIGDEIVFKKRTHIVQDFVEIAWDTSWRVLTGEE